MKQRIFVSILWLLPKKIAHKLLYYKTMKKKLNLNNPVTLNEKIQWLMVNYYGEKEGLLADKYKVKEYIESLKISDLEIPKTYFVLENQKSNFDFENLPDKFVLKCNHGSGDVFICKNKSNFNIDLALKKLSKVKKQNFAKQTLEYHYSYIKPVIMCEEYLDDSKNINPIDYKFYCYDGHVESILVCSERNEKLRLDDFDLNWNKLNYTLDKYKSDKLIDKPKNLDKMIKIASKLSQGFPFVRVDLYEIEDKVYFGELTFTPAAGLIYYYNEDALVHLGSFIDIEKIKKEVQK